MTTGLKIPSSYYMELIATFPPRPITTEGELRATQDRINSILDQKNIIQDDRDYLNVLATLVYDYEQKHEPMPALKGIELFKALIFEDNIQKKELIGIFKDEAILSDILNGNREITASQIQNLADFFHVSPTAFLSE